jgi:hypothetical protein
MFRTLTFCAVLAGLAAGGCYAEAGGGVVASDPYVVYTEPGVYVVADAGAPVYYSDGVYWRYNGGVWMWSNVSSGGWRGGREAPPRLVAIRDPGRYAADVRARGTRVRVDVVAHGHADVNGRAEGHGEMHAQGQASGHAEMHGEAAGHAEASGHGDMGAHGEPAHPGTEQRPEGEHGGMGAHGEPAPVGVATPNQHPQLAGQHGHGAPTTSPQGKSKGKKKKHTH